MTASKTLPTYSTDSLYESAGLLAQGHQPIRIEDTNSRYKLIVFVDTPQLRKAVSSFYNNSELSGFINAFRKLKGQVFSRKEVG